MTNCILKFLVGIGFVFLFPVMLISAFVIFIEDGFPIIFIQERVGKDEKIFKIFKLRTMKKNTPMKATHYVSKENYLFFGSYLRKFKIDELPQLINYFKNDIYLIGPRPCLPSQITLIQERRLNQITSLKPGITGLSQVMGYDMSNPVILSKVDGLYLSNKSLRLDVYIFLATFTKFFKNKLRKIFIEDLIVIDKNV